MSAGRKGRDEQNHTLGSCCSEQQVWVGGRGAQLFLWKAKEKKNEMEGVGGVGGVTYCMLENLLF